MKLALTTKWTSETIWWQKKKNKKLESVNLTKSCFVVLNEKTQSLDELGPFGIEQER